MCLFIIVKCLKAHKVTDIIIKVMLKDRIASWILTKL